MGRDVERRQPRRRRSEHARPTAADSGSAEPVSAASAFWLQLQRDAGNEAVATALERARAASEIAVQRAGDDTEQPDSTELVDATRALDVRQVTKLLRRRHTEVDQRDSFGTTALIYAVDKRNRVIAKLLLDAGADPNIVSTEASDDGSKGDTALKVAVTNNDVAMAAYLMDRGSRMEVRDLTGLTAPAWAARRGSLGCLALFVAKGWPIDQVDADGFTLLAWAATGGQLGTAQWLLASGMRPTAIPAALVAARRQSDAYGAQASDLAHQHVPAEERPEQIAAVSALSAKATAVDGVIAYLESQQAVPPTP